MNIFFKHYLTVNGLTGTLLKSGKHFTSLNMQDKCFLKLF